jgi:hypothetical protein
MRSEIQAEKRGQRIGVSESVPADGLRGRGAGQDLLHRHLAFLAVQRAGNLVDHDEAVRDMSWRQLSAQLPAERVLDVVQLDLGGEDDEAQQLAVTCSGT